MFEKKNTKRKIAEEYICVVFETKLGFSARWEGYKSDFSRALDVDGYLSNLMRHLDEKGPESSASIRNSGDETGPKSNTNSCDKDIVPISTLDRQNELSSNDREKDFR